MALMTPVQPSWVVCEHCGQAHRWQPLAPGAVARCVRCNAVLGHGHRLGLQALLALTLTALIVLLIAHASPLIAIRLAGAEVQTSFLQAVAISWQAGDYPVAALALFTAVLAPALFIGLRLYLMLSLLRGRQPAGHAACLRALHLASRWNTVEVLTVGALLALVRIADLAQAQPGPGLLAFGLLALLLAAIESAGLRHLWWHVP